ncbi:hypothetical protein X777_06971 [Ooceraea biroi]|uniref:Uncharacterized protein n=1 Tax=Ooceraea biroi TaxID=2015173 RepID=A0A026WC77_OOCBI|nr:hypothetical protein X777_06971 [Ooceraea biroi]
MENWHLLPEHLRLDPEVRRYRRCVAPYQPWQDTHIDRPAPLIRDCSQCRAFEERRSRGGVCDKGTQTYARDR